MKKIWESAISKPTLAKRISQGDTVTIRTLLKEPFAITDEAIATAYKWMEKNGPKNETARQALLREVVLQDCLNKCVGQGHATAFEEFFDSVIVKNASLKSATSKLSESIGGQNAFRGLKAIALMQSKYATVSAKLAKGKTRGAAIAFGAASEVPFTSRNAFRQLTGKFPS